MKKLIYTAILCSMLCACGAEPKTIDGVTYGTYGIANQDEMKNPNIRYNISGWSLFWSFVFCETIVVPIYFIGWDLFQLDGKKDPNGIKGSIN